MAPMKEDDPPLMARARRDAALGGDPVAPARREAPGESALAQAESDDGLVARMADGDTEALAELYRRHGRAAYSLAVAITGDGAAAEEVVQDAFVRAWRGAGAFEAQGRCLPWLLQIVRRLALDERRRRRRELDTVAWPQEDLVDDGHQPEAAAEERDVAVRVRRAISSLTPEQREAVRFVYFGGLSQSEAARALNIPLGTAKGRLRAAYEHLRSQLEAERP